MIRIIDEIKTGYENIGEDVLRRLQKAIQNELEETFNTEYVIRLLIEEHNINEELINRKKEKGQINKVSDMC